MGDAAYPLLETLLIPFTGSQQDNVDNDAFNFYMSQLRIRIEMTFGRLVNKFRILKRPLETKLQKSSKVIMACACLHNFVIDEDMPEEEDSFNDSEDANAGAEIIAGPEGAPRGMAYLPTMPEEDFEIMDGVSQTRDAIVEAIHDLALRRPHHNLVRNSRKSAIEEEGLQLIEFSITDVMHLKTRLIDSIHGNRQLEFLSQQKRFPPRETAQKGDENSVVRTDNA